ncbi:ABC transporter ATP-binding protein [Microbaculum marinum]|uniref:ATP-binding cassette domain-containing protein n=1 Tax=Microbaculum marinum TaxID=1764581 RepID=A0AAW9RMS6_9HYPH
MTALLEVDRAVKRFGGISAVNDLSFKVEAGESLGLIGPNGAGKTTVFSLIMGEHRLNSGAIRLNGTDISALPTYERIKRGVARTYQVPRPFSEINVAENIRVGLMPDSLRLMLTEGPDPDAELELARSVGFGPADLERKPSQLSMGDLRKLELARTLATAPQIILLDEVFAGLTVGEIAQISDLIARKRAEGMTFVIVSHDLRSLQPLIDRAVVMTFGQVIAEGSFESVMSDEKVRAAYLGH